LGGSDESDPYLDIPKRYAETALEKAFYMVGSIDQALEKAKHLQM
jgi:F0F1-type ATP synthase beta subunit